MGPAAGGAVYSPALTDFVVMVEGTRHMFITGPDVIKTVTGEDVTFEELGGAHTPHDEVRRRALPGANEEDAITYVKRPAVLPALQQPGGRRRSSYRRATSVDAEDQELDTLIPDSANQPYDMHTVIEHVLDDGEFLEVQRLFAPNIIVGFGRVEGAPVGVVANQPMQFAGTLDIDASEKAARFVRTCDAFNIPIADVRRRARLPARRRPGVGRHHPARRQAAVRLLPRRPSPRSPSSPARPTAARTTSWGPSTSAPTSTCAWPTAQIAVMGARAPSTSCTAGDRRGRGPGALRAELVAEYEDTLANPYIAAERGYVDAVIRPSETRGHHRPALRPLRTKRETLPPKKHGNIPL